MDDILDALVGLDKKNEIFNLWYEVTFLRMIVSHMVAQSIYLQEVMTPQVIEECREHAQKIVRERFPLIKIDFSQPTEEQSEAKRKHLENLMILQQKMGRSTGESKQESPCCTHSDSSESHPVSQNPLSEA